VGKEIKSVALIANGYHARTDGCSSLATLCWVFCVWLGHPLADPLIGLLVTIAIIE
jgi:divalent metal cation (Fe/Co/Zn/Cd) transporter